MPVLKLRIGDKGGGKSTGACADAQIIHAYFPKTPIISNTPIWWENVTEEQKLAFHKGEYPDVPMAIFKREALKFLAIKTILKDQRYAYVIIDESAIAEDLESRGSSAYSTAPKTYLLALSRKVVTDIDLITQMMSMVDKRAQWLGDVPMYCLAHFLPESNIPEYFEYQIWDSALEHVINSFDLDGQMAKEYVFPRFDTGDVPLSDDKLQAFRNLFNISEADEDSFQFDMELKRFRTKYAEYEKPMDYRMKYYKKKGTHILLEGEHYIVIDDPEYDPVAWQWIHHLAKRFPKQDIVEEQPTQEELRERQKQLIQIQEGNPEVINEVTKEFQKEVGIQNEQDIRTEDKSLYRNDT